MGDLSTSPRQLAGSDTCLAALSAAVDIESLILRGDGLATTSQLLTAVSRKQLAGLVKSGMLNRVCHGVYAPNVPDVSEALDAAQLRVGRPVVACMGTAAALYGFDTERTTRIHVLDPGIRMRPSPKIMVHQRIGAPLRRVKGHLATTRRGPR